MKSQAAKLAPVRLSLVRDAKRPDTSSEISRRSRWWRRRRRRKRVRLMKKPWASLLLPQRYDSVRMMKEPWFSTTVRVFHAELSQSGLAGQKVI